jgi:nitrogen regulatory protein P-II 1
MKCIDVIVKPTKVEDVKERARQVGVKSMMLSKVTDCSSTDGRLRIYRGSSYVIRCVDRVRIQLIVDEDRVGPVVDAIVATAGPGEMDNGNILIYSVETKRIRTDEHPYVPTRDQHLDHAKVA